MKKAYIYVVGLAIMALLFVTPNLDYITADIASLKQDLPLVDKEQEEPNTESQSLPSFLESSSGVTETPELGLVGSGDPTTPLTYTEDFVTLALQNDELIYGEEISEEVKKEMMENLLGNAILDENISNNATNNSDKSQSSGIKVVKALADFINFK